MFPGDCLRAPVVDDRACRCAEEENGIGNPGEHLRAKQRAVDDVLARLSERDEVTGEVSTVDRGYILGIEGAEVTRVIPVIEVTTEALEADSSFRAWLQAVRLRPRCRASRNRAQRWWRGDTARD